MDLKSEQAERVLKLIGDSLEGGKDFVLREAPDVVQELIVWKRAESLLLAGGLLALVLLCWWRYARNKILGKIMHRPVWLNVPAFAARLAFGEMADEMLLSGQKVLPKRLLNTGFDFKYTNVEQALNDITS